MLAFTAAPGLPKPDLLTPFKPPPSPELSDVERGLLSKGDDSPQPPIWNVNRLPGRIGPPQKKAFFDSNVTGRKLDNARGRGEGRVHNKDPSENALRSHGPARTTRRGTPLNQTDFQPITPPTTSTSSSEIQLSNTDPVWLGICFRKKRAKRKKNQLPN